MKPEESKSNQSYITLGLMVGMTWGIVFDNLGLGMTLGLAIGAAIDAVKRRKNKDNN